MLRKISSTICINKLPTRSRLTRATNTLLLLLYMLLCCYCVSMTLLLCKHDGAAVVWDTAAIDAAAVHGVQRCRCCCCIGHCCYRCCCCAWGARLTVLLCAGASSCGDNSTMRYSSLMALSHKWSQLRCVSLQNSRANSHTHTASKHRESESKDTHTVKAQRHRVRESKDR